MDQRVWVSVWLYCVKQLSPELREKCFVSAGPAGNAKKEKTLEWHTQTLSVCSQKKNTLTHLLRFTVWIYILNKKHSQERLGEHYTYFVCLTTFFYMFSRVLSYKVTQSYNTSPEQGVALFPKVNQLLPPFSLQCSAVCFQPFLCYEISCHRHRSSNRKHWPGDFGSFGMLSQEALNFLLLAPKTTSQILPEHGCCTKPNFCFRYSPFSYVA